MVIRCTGVGVGGATGAVDCAVSVPLPLLLVSGTVVRRPVSPFLLLAEAREPELRSRTRGEGRRSSRMAGIGVLLLAWSIGGAFWLLAEAGATCRLFTTVFTPSTCAASWAAALRAASLATVPVSVTVPPLALMFICLSGTLPSPLILFCTSEATCASGRDPTREHPAANIARATRTTPILRFISISLL